jgi:hypothetical protein
MHLSVHTHTHTHRWVEYREYAAQAARFGTAGMQWSDVSNDPRNGFAAVSASHL